MHQRLKKLRFWVSLRPSIPLMSMSGSFQWPGPAAAYNFSLAAVFFIAVLQSAFPGAQMSPVVRQRCPTEAAHFHGSPSPHEQRLKTMGLPAANWASRSREYAWATSCPWVLHQSILT